MNEGLYGGAVMTAHKEGKGGGGGGGRGEV